MAAAARLEMAAIISICVERAGRREQGSGGARGKSEKILEEPPVLIKREG